MMTLCRFFRALGARNPMLLSLSGQTDDDDQNKKYELLPLILTHAIKYSILFINVKLILNCFTKL